MAAPLELAMASHVIQPPPPEVERNEEPLSYEEGWELLRSMRGMLRENFAKLGGAEEYLRKERESWDEDAE